MVEKVKFSDMDKKIQMDHCSVIFLVSPEKNPDNEAPGQFENILERVASLPENIKGKFFSYKIGSTILEIGKKFNLQLLQVADISRAIRAYYFGELKLEDMPTVLAREIPIDLAKAQEISRMIIQKIINDNSVEEASQAKLAQMTVADALKAYPEVGEQLITSEKIVLKNFPGPVRPCLKNWLADFTFTLGRDKHTAMDRGIYLFQSANGKRLNSQDRNKLAFVLKAYDEGLPVSINKDVKQIVFTANNTAPAENKDAQISNFQFPISKQFPISNFPINQTPSPAPQNSQPKPQGFSSDVHSTVRFSSPQKLPYEKTAPVKTDNAKPDSVKPEKSDHFKASPFHYNPVSGMIYDSEKKENSDLQDKGNHINRKNVVNLKDSS